ncbi:hypothetical protein [Desulforhopalus sp. 52FAK]
MSVISETIIFIWLLPLALYVVLPLSMLMIYLLGRLIHFMLFPKRVVQEEIAPGLPVGDFEKVR